ncbi:hypothetical protein H1R20_g1132, partial [Candolleomyces eurysporus]
MLTPLSSSLSVIEGEPFFPSLYDPLTFVPTIDPSNYYKDFEPLTSQFHQPTPAVWEPDPKE